MGATLPSGCWRITQFPSSLLWEASCFGFQRSFFSPRGIWAYMEVKYPTWFVEIWNNEIVFPRSQISILSEQLSINFRFWEALSSFILFLFLLHFEIMQGWGKIFSAWSKTKLVVLVVLGSVCPPPPSFFCCCFRDLLDAAHRINKVK